MNNFGACVILKTEKNVQDKVKKQIQVQGRKLEKDWECLDEPPEVAESLFYLEALKKVEKYEPRVEISDMQFENTQGSMTVYIGFAVTGEL